MTNHPRIHIVARIAAVALTWGFLVAANPAGATEPTLHDPVTAATRGIRERSGVERRAAVEQARIARQRARTLAAAKRAKALARAKARAQAREIQRRARERARFLATHRCPVDGPYRRWLRGDWHPQPYARAVDGVGAEKRGHNGIDLFAPIGTPVRAPIDGRLYLGTSPRGGMWFKLVGRGGYAYGAHMSGFGPARGNVKAADIIGYVGRSGNARGTHPHLHFEWHPGGGPAANPVWILWNRCGPPATSYPS